MDNPANVMAVKANASAAIDGPTWYNKGPRVSPETVVKLKSATMFRPGLRAAKEAKKISAICRMKKSIMFGATKSSRGPEPKYAPIAAVTIENANKL